MFNLIIKLNLILYLTFTIISVVVANTRLDLTFSVRGLPSADPFNGAPDPLGIIEYAYSSTDQFIVIGETEWCSDVHECDWPEVFTFDFVSGINSTQRVKVGIYDWDFDANDWIGYVEFNLADVVNADGHVIERDIEPIGNGNLTIRGVVNGTWNNEDLNDKRLIKPFQLKNNVVDVHSSNGRFSAN